MDKEHYFRRLQRLAKAFGKPFCLAIAATLVLAGVALCLGRSVEFSISLFNGVQFSAQVPITVSAPAAEQRKSPPPASR